MFRKSITKNFIEKAIKIHGDKYDYTLVEYTKSHNLVKIICKNHEVFEQKPNIHLRGSGCPVCKGIGKTTENLINQFQLIHGKKYDYNLVEYVNAKTKVKIICKEHGIFEQIPNSHINKRGCPKCANNQQLTIIEFIAKAIKIHGSKYDYSQINYKNTHSTINIICKEHGIFKQKVYSHLNGHGCFKCDIKKKTDTKTIFMIKAIKKHTSKYDYLKVKYVNSKTKVKIICPVHGIFKQVPNDHLQGNGCPICNESKGEKEIRYYLENFNIEFESQKRFDGCKNIYTLPFDFYLPLLNMCVEYDGKQHYESIEFFGGEEGLKYRQENDKAKTKYCKDNDIKLLRIKYDEDIKNLIIKLL